MPALERLRKWPLGGWVNELRAGKGPGRLKLAPEIRDARRLGERAGDVMSGGEGKILPWFEMDA